MKVPGSTSVFISIPSTGTPPASSSRANSQAPGSCSCEHQELDVPAAGDERRQKLEQVRLRDPEIPATFWTWRMLTRGATSSSRSAQCPAECAFLDAFAKLAPSALRSIP